MKYLFFVAALIASSSAYSAFYKCVVDGKTTFTDQPCEENAKSEEVHIAPFVPVLGATSNASNDNEQQKQEMSSTSIQRMNQATARLYKERREAELERAIVEKREHITNLQVAMELEVAKLRVKKNYSNNNLAGATWESSISEEISATVKRYDSKIEVAQKDIDRMYKELESL
jgi:hypothetical protein